MMEFTSCTSCAHSSLAIIFRSRIPSSDLSRSSQTRMIPSPPALASHPAPATFLFPNDAEYTGLSCPSRTTHVWTQNFLVRFHTLTIRLVVRPRGDALATSSPEYCQMAPNQWRPRCWCAPYSVTVLSLKQDARILGLVTGRISK